MVHSHVFDKYIHCAIIYKTDHIFPVLLIKHLANQNSEPTTPHKLETGTKKSVSNQYVLFFPCAVRKGNAHVDTKVFNIHHKLKKEFWASLL